jgi:hypothetical protein
MFDFESKLTLHADCSQELIRQDSCYRSFVKIMIKHDSKQVIFFLNQIQKFYLRDSLIIEKKFQGSHHKNRVRLG